MKRESSGTSLNVRIPCEDVQLEGSLTSPHTDSKGIIAFAHGSGSGRLSPRNAFVAAQLNAAGFHTLLLDLLTDAEEMIDLHTGHLRFNIPFLARRLMLATEWLNDLPKIGALPIGYFGASTGAGAALVAAAGLSGDRVQAIVSRGGRPDLAGEHLARVSAPTLLIVGDMDEPVLDLNRDAMLHMRPDLVSLEIVRGATHLFEEPGTLEQVADLAAGWFSRYLRPQPRRDVNHYWGFV